MKDIKRLAIIAMFLSISVVLGYVESLIPMFIPGVKIGLANVIILIMLYEFKFYEALIVDILRIFIVSLILSTFLTPVFYMSLAGGILSYLVMLLFSRINFFSPIGVSVIGAIFHCIGQVLVAMFLLSTSLVLYYLPFIMLFSVLTGIVTGIITKFYLKMSITNIYLNKESE